MENEKFTSQEKLCDELFASLYQRMQVMIDDFVDDHIRDYEGDDRDDYEKMIDGFRENIEPDIVIRGIQEKYQSLLEFTYRQIYKKMFQSMKDDGFKKTDSGVLMDRFDEIMKEDDFSNFQIDEMCGKDLREIRDELWSGDDVSEKYPRLHGKGAFTNLN